MANQEGIINEDILGARLQFRNLLEEYGLISLAGSEADALSWLETQIIGLADSVSRRERFLGLLKQTREVLRGGQQRCVEPPGAETKGRLNPYAPRGFRKFNI